MRNKTVTITETPRGCAIKISGRRSEYESTHTKEVNEKACRWAIKILQMELGDIPVEDPEPVEDSEPNSLREMLNQLTRQIVENAGIADDVAEKMLDPKVTSRELAEFLDAKEHTTEYLDKLHELQQKHNRTHIDED